MKAIYIAARDPSGSAARLARRPVGEVMSKPVLSVAASTQLGDALRAMVGAGVRHLVVVDPAGRCVGVLADRLIAAAWAADPSVLSYQRVSSVLDREPATLGLDAAVVDAARLMRGTGVDAVAVVDSRGTAVGIVTGSDLVALLAR
jgi:predicted transcriptional regulator